jgi:ACS family tartrate transporter-like MFS transporter
MVTMLPYICGAIAMLLWGLHSDRTGERRWHIAGSAFIAAIGFLIASRTDNVWVGMAAFALGAMGIYGSLPIFWTLPTAMLTGAAAAAGIALINSVGTLSGYVGPVMMGRLKDSTGGYAAGLGVLAASMALSGALILFVGRTRGNRQ